MDYIAQARCVIQKEIDGLTKIQNDLGESFIELVELSLRTLRKGGKIVLTGVGKSGHIGHKLAATLTSTGSPAAFMHPIEAMHGDLGILSENDILIALSYSGETDELLAVLPSAKRFEVPIVAITGDAESRLAQCSDLVVTMKINEEACPFNLAPTTSTTALLALGDALAIVLLEAQDFSEEDYGRFHPAGSIGRSVTLKVADVMRSSNRIAIVTADVPVKDALMKMTECRTGSVLVVDYDRRLLGIFTDGDFRRNAQEDLKILNLPISEVMTREPMSVSAEIMAVSVMKILEAHNIDDIPVVDKENKVVGLIDIQDLPKFKLM